MASDFHDFFLASAGVAGSLTGLLFVAVSIAHDRLSAPDVAQISQVRAATALTAFLNGLAVSLFALIPGIGAGWPAFAVAVSGLLFTAAAWLSLVRVRGTQPGGVRDGAFLTGLAVALVFELIWGLRAARHPAESGPVETIAVLVIVCFLIGIARSWELIGGPNIGIWGELWRLFRPHAEDASDR